MPRTGLTGLLFFLVVAVLCPQLSGSSQIGNSIPTVILDTDLDSDVDDVGAIAMLLNLHRAGIIELAGIVVTSDDPFAPVCASSILRFYGFPEIPVGFLKNQPVLKNHSRYTKRISEEYKPAFSSWKDAEDAAVLYRKLLSRNPDKSVTIVSIGYLSSLQQILQSAADDISPLNGHDLVNQKVSRWICMGGQFPQGKEANFYRPDPQSTAYCLANWRKEVVFCGWEVGNKIITGGQRMKNVLSKEHLLYRSYELYNNFAGRPSWDQVAVLLLTGKSGDFFQTVRGNCWVAADGSNTWEDNPAGKHQMVSIKSGIPPEEISAYIEMLMTGSKIHSE